MDMVDINSTVSIITLHIKDLNAPAKRQRLSEWIKTQDPNTRGLQENFTHR